AGGKEDGKVRRLESQIVDFRLTRNPEPTWASSSLIPATRVSNCATLLKQAALVPVGCLDVLHHTLWRVTPNAGGLNCRTCLKPGSGSSSKRVNFGGFSKTGS